MPHLPDSTDISVLKDDICSILENNSNKIELIKSEINELASSADSIVKELDTMKSKGVHVSLMQHCEYCTAPNVAPSSNPDVGGVVTGNLFSQPFYLFPCGHGYHCDCLVRVYIGDLNSSGGKALSGQGKSSSIATGNAVSNCILTPEEVGNIKQIMEQMTQMSSKVNRDGSAVDKRLAQQYESLQAQLDGHIATDCPLCGDVMIRLVGISLCTTGNKVWDDAEAKSWEL